MIHELKIWPHLFAEVLDGRKTFDVRSTADRCFQAGDLLVFRPWDQGAQRYVGEGLSVTRNVLAVYSGMPGVLPGYAVLALGPPLSPP